MSADLALHNFIEQHNVLKQPTEQIGEFCTNHPLIYKTTLVAVHVIRALMTAAFCAALPFSVPVNLAVCFVGSLLYRLVVEIKCSDKFALPAFAGSIAIPIATTACTELVNGIAFASLGAAAVAFASLIPLAAYMTYVVLTVNYDVNERC